MANNKSTPRKFVFIDAMNFENSVKELGYTEVDYENLYRWLTEKRGCTAIYFYAGEQAGDTITTDKHKKIRGHGFKMRLKSAKIFKNKEGLIDRGPLKGLLAS